MRLAFADPPYLGCCKLYGHRHEEPYGCWDDPETHRALMVSLYANYDGWALSASSTSLQELLPLLPIGPARARIGAWVKPFAAYKRNVRVAYTWEPVIFREARVSSREGALVTRDHLACPITMRRGLTGAKPEKFCEWVRNLLGWMPGDELVDLFPGTGVMGAVMAQEAML
jgi:hypothetical protein